MSMVYPQGHEDARERPQSNDTIDNLIALGVLLWVVAQADEKFLPEEKTKIEDVLSSYGEISEEDMPVVLRAVEEASISRIDLYAFTSEIGKNLTFKAKIGIIENLFRVACIDQDLDHEELEAIRKISGLLRIDHKDFIDVKIKVKKEFGLDTAGL
ncbi:MAG: TerB family tellurite resistance protein [Candidatus Omnitrophica bacterium]|nr:TerB family tellurite resistance protein [Candidatus Omnitrophota bacterium]